VPARSICFSDLWKSLYPPELFNSNIFYYFADIFDRFITLQSAGRARPGDQVLCVASRFQQIVQAKI